jgi:glutathione S-transferase
MPLYGTDVYAASRIDSFLDASLVFGRDTQPYLLALRGDTLTTAIHAGASAAVETYLGGIERALAPEREVLVGATISLADICFACELTMLWYERPRHAYLATLGLAPVLPTEFATDYPLVAGPFARLRAHAAFAPDLGAHLARLEGRVRS